MAIARVSFSSIRSRSSPEILIGLAVLAAALLRVWLLATTWDTPGDGPSRATLALALSRDFTIPRAGIWPPGFSVLTAGVVKLTGEPLLGTRLVNVVLGTATVWLVAAATRPIGGPLAAVGAACIVAFSRLHSELSATALSEATFAFPLLLAQVLASRAAGARDGRRASVLDASGAIVLALAETIRYEAWVVAAAWVALELLRGRRARAAWLAVVLAPLPILWTIGNAMAGDALAGFRAASQDPYLWTGARSAPLAAVRLVGSVVSAEFGPLLGAATIVGAAGFAVKQWRRGIAPDSLPAVWVPLVLWLLLLGLARDRGETLFNRYVVGAMLASLPVAVGGTCWLLDPQRGKEPANRARPRAAIAWLVLLVLSATLWPAMHSPPAQRWLTTRPPAEMEAFAQWHASGSQRDLDVIATPMGWTATYLPLIDPVFLGRMDLVSLWRPDAEVTEILRRRLGRGSFLLLTSADDAAEVRRLQALSPVPLGEPAPRASFGRVEVYELRSAQPGPS